MNEVRITGANVLITYKIPLPPDVAIDEQARVLSIVHGGGAGGIRTPYLLTASQALSQLSYSPEAILKFSIKPIGIQEEPALDFS